MFRMKECYRTIRSVLKCDYLPYKPPSLRSLNQEHYQFFIDFVGEDSVISLNKS